MDNMQSVIPDNRLQAVRIRLLEEIKATQEKNTPRSSSIVQSNYAKQDGSCESDPTPYGSVSKHDG